jgi:hypothetical protein
MISATMRKSTCDRLSISETTGAAVAPSACSAKPKITEKQRICRMSTRTKASTGLDGMIARKKSLTLCTVLPRR